MTKRSIKDLRAERGMTQMVLAIRLNVSVTTVNNWEGRKHRPSEFFVARLCDLFGVTADELDIAPLERGGVRPLVDYSKVGS